MKNINNIVILHDIRSVENVGAIFRTADAGGVDKIYLTGYTPAPVDRFGRKRADFHKSALGAEDSVLWEQKENFIDLLNDLKRDEYYVIAIEQDENSINYKEINIKDKNVFLVGNEVTGIDKEILKLCDVVAEIPMKGKKESLNVATSFGIALFRILNI
ncbi:MAG: TrmH family RNA methyltransferase [bacterium]|nr:TrmH family RNA methyltransferase [bacterium]